MWSMRLFICMSLSCSAVFAQVAQIQGDFGYALGDKLASDKVEQTKSNEDGSKQYRMKTSAPIAEVWVQSNKQQVIYRITGYSQPLSPIVCAERVKAMRKDIETNKPGLGTYAMDDAEMYYDEQRTLVFQCEKLGNEKRLRIEYADDRLAEQ